MATTTIPAEPSSTPNNSLQVQIRPGEIPRDLPAIGALTRVAFSYSSRVFFPAHHSHPNPEEQELSLQKDEELYRETRVTKRLKDGCPLFVAVIDDKVVGVAQWKPPKGDDRWKWKSKVEAGEQDEDEEIDVVDTDTPPPASFDVEKYEVVMAGVEANERKILDEVGVKEEDIWYLMTIATAPDQKRRGIGKMLMQWGLEQAKADKKHVFLTATNEGKFLYEKVGFKQLGEFEAAGRAHYGMILFHEGEK